MRKRISIVIILFLIISILINKNHNYNYNYDDKFYLAVLVNGNNQNNFPEKADYEVSIYCNNSNIKWDYDDWKLIIKDINSNTSCSVSFTNSSKINLASYIISLSNAQGTNGVYNENGYRYEGKNPNNWIMFNGEYWRIIGVFDDATHGRTEENLVKIIREDSIGGLVWGTSGHNNWSESSLNALLNNNYYNGINEDTTTGCYGYYTNIPANCDFTLTGITKKAYREMIENVTWKLGGYINSNATTETFYTAERGTNVYGSNPITWSGKIGLMYPSDYGYSVPASFCPRTTNLGEYDVGNCAGQSWIYGKAYDWTITPHSNGGSVSYYVTCVGDVYQFPVGEGALSVRPTLYLKSNIQKLAGDGSLDNPYIITSE